MELEITRASSPVKSWENVTKVVVREGVLTDEMKRDIMYASRELKLTIHSETPEARAVTSVLFTGA